jgi:hypothetical protein
VVAVVLTKKGTDLESIWLRGGPLSDGVAVGL